MLQFRKLLFKYLSCLFLCILSFLQSCNKETLNEIQSEEQRKIESLKNIVGNKGIITVLKNEKYGTKNSLSTSVDTTTKTLSLAEFEKVFTVLKDDTTKYATTIGLLQNILSTDSVTENLIKKKFDLSNDPRPAGLYQARLRPMSNGNPSLFSNMSLTFNTDASGRIIGNPTISFSGITLFNWQQTNMSNINFNPFTFTNSFVITGVANFGISNGSINLSWTSSLNFEVEINMNEFQLTPINIRVKSL